MDYYASSVRGDDNYLFMVLFTSFMNGNKKNNMVYMIIVQENWLVFQRMMLHAQFTIHFNYLSSYKTINQYYKHLFFLFSRSQFQHCPGYGTMVQQHRATWIKVQIVPIENTKPTFFLAKCPLTPSCTDMKSDYNLASRILNKTIMLDLNFNLCVTTILRRTNS